METFMKRKLKLFISGTALLLLAACSPTSNPNDNPPEDICIPTENDDSKVHLVILAGQSGARGKAVNTDLTEDQKMPNLDIDIIEDGYQMSILSNIPETISQNSYFKELKPGFGDSGAEHGPEIGMGFQLETRYQKGNEDRKAGIIKFTACGSTFIDDWYTESSVLDSTVGAKLNKKQIRTNEKIGKEVGPLTNNLYQLIDKAIDDLDAEGYEAVIDGVVFSHGEQDAKYDANMEIYETCLTNFIKDIRGYVGNENLPVVIGEAKTNSAKYSNKLREIQARVAKNDKNTVLIDSRELNTNTFEPWHMGAQDNFEFGRRAVEEIIKLKDSRKVESFSDVELYLPKDKKVELPKYVNASFDSGFEGLASVTFSDYDATKAGDQKVEFKSVINCNEKKGEATLHIGDYPYVDGIVDEALYTEAYDFGELGKAYIKRSDAGLAIAAKINDSDIWTDGENWRVGDMGQRGKNDDLRIYLTDSDTDALYTVALSSANLLRVYDSAVDLETSKDTELIKHNLFYKKEVTGVTHNVTTKGDVNGGVNTGLEFELYIPYDSLGYDKTSEIKAMISYSNISYANAAKNEEITYLTNKGQGDSSSIQDVSNYFDI